MNEQEVLGAFLLVNNPIVLSEEETKDVQKAIENLQQENRKQKEIINEAISIINEHFKHHPELLTENQREYDLIRKIEHILKEK